MAKLKETHQDVLLHSIPCTQQVFSWGFNGKHILLKHGKNEHGFGNEFEGEAGQRGEQVTKGRMRDIKGFWSGYGPWLY